MGKEARLAEGPWQGPSHCLIFPRTPHGSVAPPPQPPGCPVEARPSVTLPGRCPPGLSLAPLCTPVLAQLITGRLFNQIRLVFYHTWTLTCYFQDSPWRAPFRRHPHYRGGIGGLVK